MKRLFVSLLLLLMLGGCQTNEDTAAPAVSVTVSDASPAAAEDRATATVRATPTMLPPTETPAPAEAETAANGAGNADVLFVEARETGTNTYTFNVTVAHPDTGWEDYADGWDVVLPDGTVVKANPEDAFTRVLLHPHENEQPFTRSQSNIAIPADVTSVIVRAHDLVDGFGGREVVVDLETEAGSDFEVTRP